MQIPKEYHKCPRCQKETFISQIGDKTFRISCLCCSDEKWHVDLLLGSNMVAKIFVKGGGGLGDLIREYLGGQDYWGYLRGIKEKYPDIKIKAILCCHNPQATEFLRCNPYLDSIEQYPWQVDGTPIFDQYKEDYVFIKDIPEILDGLRYEKPMIYLTEQEEELVKDIQDKDKYIFIHPFAGLRDRIAFPISEYPNLIDRLIDLDFNVVVVGGSYRRINQNGNDDVEEVFSYQREGLFNLVGKSNARVAVRLIQMAYRFIGTHSCYILVSWSERIKSILLVLERLREYLHSDDANVWAVRDSMDFNKTIYIDDKSDIKEIKKEIIKGVLDGKCL